MENVSKGMGVSKLKTVEKDLKPGQETPQNDRQGVEDGERSDKKTTSKVTRRKKETSEVTEGERVS